MNYSNILNKQKSFFLTGTTRSITFRKNILLKLQQLIADNESLFYEAIYQDFHKSKFDTYTTEISIIYAEIKYLIKHLNKLTKPQRRPINLANIPGRFRILREPLGNTLIIGAWNYPYQLTLLPAIDAIAAGNTCIIKPSELPINTMNLIANLINNNFDSQLLYVATGGIDTTTELLQLHYDKIFFTGSPHVGNIVYQAAARTLTPITLELGGKSPVIVTPNTNIDIAAKRIVWGKFLNAGQTCVAPDYLYVEKSIAPNLIDAIKKYIIINEYAENSQQYVSIINQRNFERILQLIDPSKLNFGGKSNPETRYIEPTLLINVTWDDPVMQQEIFGPILPILIYTEFNQVINEIQQHPKPLAAYLFSNDKAEQQYFLNTISAGGVCINDVMMHLSSPPFRLVA